MNIILLLLLLALVVMLRSYDADEPLDRLAGGVISFCALVMSAGVLLS